MAISDTKQRHVQMLATIAHSESLIQQGSTSAEPIVIPTLLEGYRTLTRASRPQANEYSPLLDDGTFTNPDPSAPLCYGRDDIVDG